MKLTLPLALLFATGVLALPCAAILTRSDRDDEEYRELATRYPAAVPLGQAAGTGTLIAPRWVLTSARSASSLRAAAATLQLAGRPVEIQEVVVHPDWRSGGDADIALLFLRQPVAGVEPIPPYREPDEAEQTARIVGYGETGRIGSAPGQRRADGQARAAINTVDRVAPRSLAMRIKGPEDASDLQGALADGDSGAPAFFESGGRTWVAGVASSPGAWETYVRVSAFTAWIEDVMFRAALQEAARDEEARKRKAKP